MPAFLTPLKPPDDLLIRGDHAHPDTGSVIAAADLIGGLHSLWDAPQWRRLSAEVVSMRFQF
jgi:hypothetical protein